MKNVKFQLEMDIRNSPIGKFVFVCVFVCHETSQMTSKYQQLLQIPTTTVLTSTTATTTTMWIQTI